MLGLVDLLAEDRLLVVGELGYALGCGRQGAVGADKVGLEISESGPGGNGILAGFRLLNECVQFRFHLGRVGAGQDALGRLDFFDEGLEGVRLVDC